MSNYSKTTDFAAKDSLPSGDSGKIIRGSEFETEFDAISTAIATKADAASPTFTGTVTIDGLTVNGNTVLGNAATDTVTVTADIASNLIPSADDTYNLGASGAEWNDLFIDGTANIDSLVADTADINGGTIDGVTIGGSSAGAITGTTITGTSFVTSGNMTFGDNDKAVFGAGTDLEIFHDGSNSHIKDAGSGGLRLSTNQFRVYNAATDELSINAVENGTVELYYDNAKKLSTTSTGIDVTGTVVADGLTVDGIATISEGNSGATAPSDANTLVVENNGNSGISILSPNSSNGQLRFGDVADNSSAFVQYNSTDNLMTVGTSRASGELRFTTGNVGERMRIDASGNVGIGTNSPSSLLHVASNGEAKVTIQGDVNNDTGEEGALLEFITDGTAVHHVIGQEQGSINDLSIMAGEGALSTIACSMVFKTKLTGTTTSSEAMRIDSAGNVGIGTASPNQKLVIDGGSSNSIVRIQGDSVLRLDFGASSDPDAGRVEYDSSGNSMRFYANNTEHMRIASSGNVGIGTFSPSHRFVSSTTNSYGQLRLQSDDTDNAVQYMGLTFRQHDKDEEGYAGILGYADSDENRISIGGSTGLFNAATVLQFFTAANHTTVTGTERMRISSNGNVGIGTTDPDSCVNNGLAVQKQVDEDVISTLFLGPSSTDRGFRFAHGEFSGVRHFYQIFNGTPSSTEGTYTQGAYGGTSVIKFDNSGHLDFYTTGQVVSGSSTSVTPSHAVRISSSGQVLVGKTASTSATVGCELRQDGHVVGTRSGAVALTLNRTTSDGSIAEFRKDGSTIGNIGVFAGDMLIGKGDHKLRFFDGSNAISPCVDDGTVNDNAISLGVANSRFKDLYLSGGAYLGGTAAANKLDDYEEGTWNPVIADASTGGNTGTATTAVGSYTKVGRQVTVNVRIDDINTTGMTGANNLFIRGLPFTAGSGTTGQSQGAARLDRFDLAADCSGVVASTTSATANLTLRQTVDNSADVQVKVQDVTSGSADVFATITYFVS